MTDDVEAALARLRKRHAWLTGWEPTLGIPPEHKEFYECWPIIERHIETLTAENEMLRQGNLALSGGAGRLQDRAERLEARIDGIRGCLEVHDGGYHVKEGWSEEFWGSIFEALAETEAQP